METNFKNRGHFCNYCRKIIANKVAGRNFHVINLNDVIWWAWDNPELRDQILKEIIALDGTSTNKKINHQIKCLRWKYGFRRTILDDNARKKDYEQRLESKRNESRRPVQ